MLALQQGQYPIALAGLSLIEVLVVLLLMSICVTGTVTTTLKSQHLTRHMIQQSDAMLMTNNLADKMRLNNADSLLTNSHYITHLSPGNQIQETCTDLASCKAQRQAITDLQLWQQQLEQKLPGYYALICRHSLSVFVAQSSPHSCDNKPTSPLVIMIWWKTTHSTTAYSAYYSLIPTLE